MKNFGLSEYLGESSYPGILNAINEHLESNIGNCSTLNGNQILMTGFQNLNESKTPVIELKAFVTKAEEIAGDDTKLKDIIEFCRKKVKNGDFNFLINLCKEEHYANLSRTGFPAPEATLKSIEDKFGKPSTEIEIGIKNGLFDCLKSELLNVMKTDLMKAPKKPETPLTESSDISFTGLSGNPKLVSYSPVGITMEDVENNRVVLLTESDILTYDSENEKFTSLNEDEIKTLNIPSSHRRMMQAISNLDYNPITSVFSLCENWDFSLKLNANGGVLINEKEIQKNDVKGLLLESINIYKQTRKVAGFDEQKFITDADNFVCLMENYDLLIKFDKLKTIRNLNENKYLIIHKSKVLNENTPEIVTSSNGKNMGFDSYFKLVTFGNECLNESIDSLFVNNLKNDEDQLVLRNKKIVELTENQRILNKSISDNKKLQNLCESDSPAMEKLLQQEKTLNTTLLNCLENLNFFTNEFKIH